MPAPIDLTGQRFGRLVVDKRQDSDTGYRSSYWECTCDCGNKTVVHTGNLTRGFVQSCGCYHKEIMTKHGYGKSEEGKIWWKMIDRCHNPESNGYKDYGGRGITVCDEWKNDFMNFYNDMGPRPSREYSIDRKDNDKGYYKDNCRWATRIEQANNRRNSVFYTYNGVSRTVAAWARELNLDADKIRYYLNKNLTFEEAIKKLKG